MCRQALAAKAPKGAPLVTPEEGPRTILKMTQKFNRNPEVPAEQDVARRVFDLAKGHIRSATALAARVQIPLCCYPAMCVWHDQMYLQLRHVSHAALKSCLPAGACPDNNNYNSSPDNDNTNNHHRNNDDIRMHVCEPAHYEVRCVKGKSCLSRL